MFKKDEVPPEMAIGTIPEVSFTPDYKAILAQAPTIHDILARPFLYEEWLAKLQEAVNG